MSFRSSCFFGYYLLPVCFLTGYFHFEFLVVCAVIVCIVDCKRKSTKNAVFGRLVTHDLLENVIVSVFPSLHRLLILPLLFRNFVLQSVNTAFDYLIQKLVSLFILRQKLYFVQSFWELSTKLSFVLQSLLLIQICTKSF